MSTRERILDAAAVVLQERGVAHATTRSVAAAAGCSEALLYKHFATKQEIFVAVLTERLPPITIPTDDVALEDGLPRLVESLVEFYSRSFPMTASIFSAPELLADHRTGLREGLGPDVPARMVRAYLGRQQDSGRIGPADLDAVAAVLVGAALHRGLLAAYAGDPPVQAAAFGRSVAELVLPALGRG
jgi:AcrR family transcriptional regulator